MGINPKIYIDAKCPVTTPMDKEINEEENMEAFYQAICSVMEKLPHSFELIFVSSVSQFFGNVSP